MNKWSLNFKFIFILCLFIASSTGISYLGITKLAALNESMDHMVKVEMQKVSVMMQIKDLFSVQTINEKNFILEDTPEGMKEMKTRIANRDADMKKAFAELSRIMLPEEKKDLEDLEHIYAQWWDNSEKIQTFSLAGDNKAAFQLSKVTGREIRKASEEKVNFVVDKYQKSMNESSLKAAADYSNARFLMITVSLAATLTGMAIAFIVLRTLNRAIDRVISNLTDNSNQVTSAAQQIASSSEELSQAATEQAASLEQTAASVEQMNSMIQKNSENARSTSEIAISTKDSSNRGKEVILEMIGAIDDIKASNNTIKEQIDESNHKISEIVKVIAEIGNKTKVINDIVFQTKLLSFNASVEAARAGEHGKGFAVVAEEVGNLAQMSGNAAKEISNMLEGSIQKVESIVSETRQKVDHLITEGKDKVEAGTRIAKQCGDVLEEIVNNVSNVTQMAKEISSACQEQAQGIQEITKAMSQLDQVTQTNAATSEEAASAAEELSAQADSLRSVVGVLVTTIKGGESQGLPTMAALGSPSLEARTVARATAPTAKVLPLKMKKVIAGPAPTLPQAAGFGGSSVPSENDPRFEEV